MSILQTLINAPQNYQFQQAAYLIEEIADQKNLQVKYTTNNKVTFPGSDIQHIEQLGQSTIVLTLNFMGLYGVDSPLPSYFTELALRDDLVSQRWRCFVNVIAQQVYQLLYYSWKKYHLQLPGSRYRSYLQALSGGVLTKDDQKEFSQVAGLSRPTQDVNSLLVALRSFLPKQKITIKENLLRQVDLSKPKVIGLESITLAENSMLGNIALSVNSKIQILIEVQTKAQLRQLQPDALLAQQLHHFITRYLPSNITYELGITMQQQASSLCYLGCSRRELAWSVWLGEQRHQTYYFTLHNRNRGSV